MNTRHFYKNSIDAFLRQNEDGSQGDPNDPTRLPEIYDSTYNYLSQMGFEEI